MPDWQDEYTASIEAPLKAEIERLRGLVCQAIETIDTGKELPKEVKAEMRAELLK